MTNIDNLINKQEDTTQAQEVSGALSAQAVHLERW